MASIITLDGARLGATNEWGEEIPTGSSPWGDAAHAFVGWGIIAFAVGTAAFRARDAIQGWRKGGTPVQGWFGRRRRRRR